MLIIFNWSLNNLKQSFPLGRMFLLAVMHTPSLSFWPYFQKEGGGLTGSQGLEEGDFFQEGLQFLHKKQTKIWNI